ncbi:gustatory receptor for sugar taste 64a [Culex quinquefasciatus]|uniref:Gustatory receptor n=1 Tax=Culex quinquefasciatus TaxID=7176 RepID=A0A1S4K6J3_CULQU|nr:gustatory receptor for sugar taste 64a [Culex quinquefasciatus]XP_039433494.1 gustatory receptor for sugar taste 64a-like [Culex pipiens pallens]
MVASDKALKEQPPVENFPWSLHDTYHEAVRPFLIIGQIFGMFPVTGIFNRNPCKVHLEWISVRVVLNLVIFGAALVNAVAEFLRLRQVGANAKNINGLVFYIDCGTISVLFLKMATSWNQVAVKWAHVERIFLEETYRVESWWTMKRKIRIVAGMLLLGAVAEHLLSIVNLANDHRFEAINCGWQHNITDAFRHFALRKFSNIYIHFPYSTASAVFFLYVSFALTLSWNYMDIFIILLSVAIASRFNQINAYLETLAAGGVLVPNEPFWIRVRIHYVALCELLAKVDRTMSWLMLVSCATNLYFICLQTLNVISQKHPHVMNDLYYGYSLFFLIVRTVTMFLCAARIHEAAKKPLDIVSKIPNTGWCVELDRFSTQLKSETVALSGMGFFHITRQLLFSMAGTIVTYELVMLKFDRESEGKGYIPPCSMFDIERQWLPSH